MIARIRTLIEGLKFFPCDLEMKVGSRDGHDIMEGMVDVYDQGALDKTEEVANQIVLAISYFSIRFPQSSFTIVVSQSITITNIYRSGIAH